MSNTKISIRIPRLRDIEDAIRIYYENIEIGTKEIKELFISRNDTYISNSTAMKLKKIAKEKMAEKEIKNWDASRVNTKAAFEAWGLEINDLEKRLLKLQKMVNTRAHMKSNIAMENVQTEANH